MLLRRAIVNSATAEILKRTPNILARTWHMYRQADRYTQWQWKQSANSETVNVNQYHSIETFQQVQHYHSYSCTALSIVTEFEIT